MTYHNPTIWTGDEGRATRTHRLDVEQVPSQQVHRYQAHSWESPVYRAVEADWPLRLVFVVVVTLAAVALGFLAAL